MTGLDTNVLVRYLTQDDPRQSPTATYIIERLLTHQEPGFVSLVTVLEIVWVLGRVYGLHEEELVLVLERMLQIENLNVQNEQEVFEASTIFKRGLGSFEDALIGAVNSCAGCTKTLTFDRKALRLMHFELL